MQHFFEIYWPYVALAGSLIIGLAAAIHAAMTKDDVRAAIGWVGVIFLSPFFGALAYIIVGINRITRKAMVRRRAPRDTPNSGSAAEIASRSGPHFESLKHLADRISPYPVSDGNDITVLDGGDEAYPAMLKAIEGAERSILLQTYIFDNNALGQRFVDALAEAQKRGVEVRVLIDGIGARYSRPPITKALAAQGITVARFLGNVIGLNLRYANLRCHRKVMVVDDRIGFTGGMNIRAAFSSEFAGGQLDHDTHFRVEGPLVAQLISSLAHDWHFATGKRLPRNLRRDNEEQPEKGGVPARVIPTGPDQLLGSNHSVVMGAITVAQKSIRLCSPYFIPDQPLISVLGIAAERGLEVDIVIPGVNNLTLVDYAMTAQLDQMVRRGCRVWRSRGAFDHSKLLVVDSAWAYVGSSNLDPRSLRLNFELDVEIYDRKTAASIEKRILAHIEKGKQETMTTLNRRPFPERLRNRIVWLASPYL